VTLAANALTVNKPIWVQ